jgi:8-oxo-dGTP diphosphatase
MKKIALKRCQRGLSVRDATLVFILKDTSQEILLGLKKRGLGEGKWNGFGGKVEHGESIEQAAAREVQEECGIEVDADCLRRIAEIVFYFPFKPDWEQVVHAFIADAWNGEPIESAEMLPRWFDAKNIPYDKMWSDDRHWLPHALQGKLVKASFTFMQDNATMDETKIILNFED